MDWGISSVSTGLCTEVAELCPCSSRQGTPKPAAGHVAMWDNPQLEKRQKLLRQKQGVKQNMIKAYAVSFRAMQVT